MSANSPWKDMPKELKCVCGFILKQHPSQTDKQATAAGKTFDEFVSSWQCRGCRPKKAHHFSSASTSGVRRGRAPNPAFEGIPKETSCKKCGKTVKLVAQNIIDKAKILGLTVDELIATYKCRSCGGKLTKKDKNKGK